MTELAADIEQMARAPGIAGRSTVEPAVLVDGAIRSAVTARPELAATLALGAFEDVAPVRVDAELATWALDRLLRIVGHARIRGWRDGEAYVVEVRAMSPCDLATQPLAQAAVRAALDADGGVLRVSATGESDDAWPVCAIALPVAPPA